jgi:hypothetical protein
MGDGEHHRQRRRGFATMTTDPGSLFQATRYRALRIPALTCLTRQPGNVFLLLFYGHSHMPVTFGLAQCKN